MYDRKNQVIEQGITPEQVTLDAKAYPFWPSKYTVVMAGSESTSQRHELKAGFDPWIAGNLVLGGGLGAVVDGATGAMFRLPKRVSGNVASQYAVSDPHVGHMIAASVMDQAPVNANLMTMPKNNPIMPASHKTKSK